MEFVRIFLLLLDEIAELVLVLTLFRLVNAVDRPVKSFPKALVDVLHFLT